MTDNRWAGDVALVTGANKGIGREIAGRLAAEGMTVYLGARDESRGRRAERELADAGGDVRYVQLDVTDSAQIEAAVKQIDTAHGRLDLLVNNAGISVDQGLSIDAITADHVRQTYEVNVFGPVALIGACIQLLRRSGNPRVVSLSSPLGSLGLLGDPEHRCRTCTCLRTTHRRRR